MSRSYKKNLYWKDTCVHNSSKRMANKMVRRKKDIPSGGSYKKVYCSYNICDFRIRVTDEIILDHIDFTKENYKEGYNRVKKYFSRK